MPEQSASVPEESRTSFYTPPTLPKGGGTVSVGGGMLSAGGPDGSAGWQLPLPSPAGRSLSAALTLQYSSGGGNSAFGAGWECPLPAVFVMTRFGFPKYDGNDRMVGPSGEEILQNGEAGDDELLKRSGIAGDYIGTSWRARTFSITQRLEHWVPKDDPTHPGFWLHALPDNSLSLYGWSQSARLQETEEPDNPTPRRVAGWYIEETVSSNGDDHLVYLYRNEDEEGCGPEELQAHPNVANVYPDSVYARYLKNSKTLLIPADAFDENEFLEFAQFYYGELETGPDNPPPPPREKGQKIEWPVREDRHSFWRYGFNVRLRRLCRDVLLWRRTGILNGGTDATPEWVAHHHLTHDSSPVTSLLESAQQITHDPHFRMPPLEFWMTRPGRKIWDRQANEVKGIDWDPLPALNGFWQPTWQMADLYGEGIPGMLYLDNGAWHYREPQRLDNPAGSDLVTWSKAVPLAFPLEGADGTLADLNSDGQPEWLVVTNSLRGSFTLAPDGTWGTLVPLAGLPGEYAHPLARMADLTGNSQDDVVLLRALGPKSVRLYPANGTQGWMAALNEEYQGSEPLPSLDDSEHQLVAFADPAGSGQQHLVRITGDSVTLWPSLGHGRFDNALRIEGFAVDDFNASRVFLADTDGSGTTDILYMSPDGIQVFVSQCGNQYSKGVFIPAPGGVILDATCHLQVADIQGQGTADLLLTRLHGGEGNQPQSWLYRFNDHRPWLLAKVSDNAGTSTHLEYRSSAQAWLDVKAEAAARKEPRPVSFLPFPVHTISRVTTTNEITGLSLGSETTYLGGVWNAQEREFAGFSRLIQRDTNEQAELAAADLSPPSRICTWFHTGVEARDLVVEGAFTDMDADFPQGPVRFTHWNNDSGSEEVLDPAPALRSWLYHALRGQVRRTEIYGEDGSELADKPYSVVTHRLQVRMHDTADAERPSALVTPVEVLTFACERITQDPVVNQAIVLEQDEYGNLLQSAVINYPRQQSPTDLEDEDAARSFYPESLPEGLITASCDLQQYDCWINLTRTTVHNLAEGGDWAIGLPGSTRSDAVLIPNSDIPEFGYTLDAWPDLPSEYPDGFTLTGYQKVLWRKADGSGISAIPSIPALVAYTRTAMLDKASLEALEPAFELTLHKLIEDALGNPQADQAVLTRVHKRLTTPGAETLYAVLMMYLMQNNPVDTAACQVLRSALKQVISVEELRQLLMTADPAELPEGLQDALHKQSRVPDEALVDVMLWFAALAGADSDDMNTLYLALANAMPEAVFWRCVLAGCQSVDRDPTWPAHARTWLTNARTLLDSRVQAESLEDLLKRGGYIAMSRPADAPELDDPHDPGGQGAPGIPFEPAVEGTYAGHHGITVYHDETHFWLPQTVQENTITGPSHLEYTAYDIAVQKVTDAAGLTSEVKTYDWRFLTPIEILDANDNTSKVALDSLGRVLHTRFHGTEAGKEIGYDPLEPFTPPLTVEEAVALNVTKNVPVAQAFTIIADSWMPLKLLADGSISHQRCSEREWERDAERLQRDGIIVQPTMEGRAPLHVIQIQTDRYDDDPEQQVRVQVILNGGGQVLQTAIRNPEGDAFVFDSETGGLKTDADGNALIEHADVRWAVTGKTEFDNKGQPVRVWLPFYLDDWHWVSDDSARKQNEGIYADTHLYDALGREYKIARAAGEEVDGEWVNYEQRVQAYPWFTVAEDENDTWKDVIERAKRKRGQ